MSKNELQEIIQSGSVADKARLAETLGDHFLAVDSKASAKELSLFFDIVRHIIRDVEMQVRRKLAEQLAARNDPPHDLIVTLANDVVEVAFPVLAQSPVLREDDLIKLVLARTTEYRQAIAGRETLPETVSQSIVSTGDVSAISTLLSNKGATVDETTMAALVEASESESGYQELLISRHDLSDELANRLYGHVSDALRNYISDSFPGTTAALDRDLSDAVERALEEDKNDNVPDFSVLGWSDTDLPTALVHALDMEDILRFEDLFQEATQLDAPAAARTLYDMGPEGLAIACKAIGLNDTAFGKILCHLRGRRPFASFLRSAQYVKGTAYYAGLKKENAERILDEWRSPAT